MADLNPPRRRWFQFRLLTLLILVIVVAIPLAWIAKERRQSKHEQQIAERLRGLGPHMKIDFCGPFHSWKLAYDDKPQGWWRDVARKCLGERVLAVWGLPREFNDLELLAELKNLESVDLHGYRGNDLMPLSTLTSLRYLDLSFSKVDNIEPLSRLDNLWWLGLKRTKVADLTPLAGLKKLKRLTVDQSQRITKEQIDALQIALPNCEIKHDYSRNPVSFTPKSNPLP